MYTDTDKALQKMLTLHGDRRWAVDLGEVAGMCFLQELP